MYILWVLKDLNAMKLSLSNEYFINLCNLVALKNPRVFDKDIGEINPKIQSIFNSGVTEGEEIHSCESTQNKEQ